MKKNQLYINTLNTNVRRLASGWICTNFTLCFTNISYTCILPHRSMAFERLKDKVKLNLLLTRRLLCYVLLTLL